MFGDKREEIPAHPRFAGGCRFDTDVRSAKRFNVPQRTYAYYESGERMLPPHVLCALADFMASASIIFWNELIKRTKTTADAVVFLLKCGERSNAALAGISKIVQIQSRQKLGCTSTRWAERQRIIGASQIVSQQKTADTRFRRLSSSSSPNLAMAGSRGRAPCVLLGVKGGHSLT